jgi:hypothetical protein
VRAAEDSLKSHFLRFVLGGACAIAAASVLIHPFGPVRTPRSANALLGGTNVDPAVLRLLERSCQNCHSERTDWPWYSYVAPVSWLIEKDVSQARTQMNLSRWNEYPTEKQQELLGAIGAAVRNRQMPPPRYTLLHPDTKLSQSEMNDIYLWSRSERHRLNPVIPASQRGSG